jgi:hypothetical protein
MQIPRNRKLRYFAFFIVISLACWLMASSSSDRFLATPLLGLAPLFIIFSKNEAPVYREPITGKPAVLVVIFTAIFVVLMIASAMNG